MSRSRMFGDETPEESQNPSPRTTIVGGRPPEEKAQTPPVPTGLQRLLRLAAVEPGFARELIEKRSAVAAAAGVELNERERMMLQAVPEEQLRAMIENLPPPPEARRDFLRKTAATAVVLLGGAALSGCDDVRPSSPPEESVPRPQNMEATKGIRPETETPAVTGSRPDVPPPPEPTPQPPPAPEGQFAQPPEGWDGGVPPEPPPPRPDRPPPPTGILPDVPPPRPDGGTVPDEKPPPRPPWSNYTRGIRFTDEGE